MSKEAQSSRSSEATGSADSRFHYDSESGFVRDTSVENENDAGAWLTTAEEVFWAMEEERQRDKEAIRICGEHFSELMETRVKDTHRLRWLVEVATLDECLRLPDDLGTARAFIDEAMRQNDKMSGRGEVKNG